MSTKEDLFNLYLTDEEEALLCDYTGCYAEHYDETGLIGTSDTRIPELEVLKRRRELKAIVNDLYLKYVPLNKQVEFVSGKMSESDSAIYSKRMNDIGNVYKKYKDFIIAETVMDKMYDHINDVRNEIAEACEG